VPLQQTGEYTQDINDLSGFFCQYVPSTRDDNTVSDSRSLSEVLDCDWNFFHTEERLAISTQSIHRWKVHFTGYNSVADNMGLSSFV